MPGHPDFYDDDGTDSTALFDGVGIYDDLSVSFTQIDADPKNKGVVFRHDGQGLTHGRAW